MGKRRKRCGGTQPRRTARVQEKKTDKGETCDADHVRQFPTLRWWFPLPPLFPSWLPRGRCKPPNPAIAFHVVDRDPPPLALLASGFPPDNQLSAPLAPDVAETVDHVEVIPGPDGYKVLVLPPLAPSLAIDSGDRREKRKQKKMEAKLKKRNDRN